MTNHQWGTPLLEENLPVNHIYIYIRIYQKPLLESPVHLVESDTIAPETLLRIRRLKAVRRAPSAKLRGLSTVKLVFIGPHTGHLGAYIL